MRASVADDAAKLTDVALVEDDPVVVGAGGELPEVRRALLGGVRFAQRTAEHVGGRADARELQIERPPILPVMGVGLPTERRADLPVERVEVREAGDLAERRRGHGGRW